MAGIARNHHLFILAEKAKALGRKLEIAVAIGNHAAVLLGSQLYLGLGDDEYDTVGGLLGEPLQLARCRTVDLEVPAQAEIVLEGELDPAIRSTRVRSPNFTASTSITARASPPTSRA